MHLRTINSSWDYHIRKQKTTADISSEKVQRAIAVIAKRNPDYTIESVEEFLRKYELAPGDSITNGCFLLFTRENTYHTTIQMGLFASETVIKDDVTCTTDMLSQVEDVMGFIIKHINKEIIITGRAENTERWQYPLEAIRELVVNMIVHRDYTTGMHSTIKVFPDSIIFFNSGSLPSHITIKKLLSDDYVSSPRNFQIAKIFKEMGLIERYGSGIKRIRQLFLDHGLPQPEFKLMQEGFFVRVFASQVNIKSKQVTEQVKLLVQILEGEMERQEIQNKLGLLHRENFRSNYLKPAIVLGLVELTIPDKPNSRNQKYKLSALGCRYKEKEE